MTGDNAGPAAPEADQPQAQPLDLDRYVFAILTWITQKMSTSASKLYRDCYQIGISEWRVIAYLGILDRASSAQIADFHGMDRGLVSRAVGYLKQKGYVAAVTPERREVALRLTPEGIAIYNAILRMALTREEKLLDGFSAAERDTLIGFLHRMHDNLPKVVEASDAMAAEHHAGAGEA